MPAACNLKSKCLDNVKTYSWIATPQDTGHKLNIYNIFTRLPGLFVNVICTFSLPSVSSGTCYCRRHPSSKPKLEIKHYFLSKCKN